MRVRKYEINGAVIAWNGCGIVPKIIRNYLEANGCSWHVDEGNEGYWRLRSTLLSSIEMPESKNTLQNRIIEQLSTWDMQSLIEFQRELVALLDEKGHFRKTIVKYLTFTDQDPNGEGVVKNFREPYSLELDDHEMIFAFFNEYIVHSGDVVIEWNAEEDDYRITIWDTENAQVMHRVERVVVEEGPLMDARPEKKYAVTSPKDYQWVLKKTHVEP